MDLALTAEQRSLADAARGILQRAWPVSRLLELAEGLTPGSTSQDWRPLAAAGWLDPEVDLESLAILAEASGFTLNPLTWWDTLGAGRTLLLAAGELPRPVVVIGLFGDGARAAVADDRGTPTLTGSLHRVLDIGDAVDLLVVQDHDVYALPAGEVRVSRATGHGLDLLRPQGTVALSAARCRRLELADPTAALNSARLHALVLLAAECVGVTAWALECAVEHARTRTQFGKPIGAYQGVAHQLAECYAELELARSALWYALGCLAPDAGQAGVDAQAGVLAAAAVGSRAASRATEACVQVLGATGITWTHPIHLWYRRSVWIAAQLSDDCDPWRYLSTAPVLGDERWQT